MNRKNSVKNRVRPGHESHSPYHWGVMGALAIGFAAGLLINDFFLSRNHLESRAIKPAFLKAGMAKVSIPADEVSAGTAWGDIKCQNITIERPSDWIPPIHENSFAARWFFGAMPIAEVQALFRSCDLPEVQLHSLLNTNLWQYLTHGWCINPDTNVLWSLSRPARSRIYAVLARFPENKFQCDPFRFPVHREKEWLADSGLRPETVSLVNHLIYDRGHCACFSDLELCSMIPSEQERHLLVQILSRQPALLARLELHPHRDLTHVINYWTQTRPRKDIEPILESLSRVSDGASINISFFLPPFARNRLYCFPDQVIDPRGELDCLWSALNFFNVLPDNRLLDKVQRQQVLKNDYVTVDGDPTLGDVLLWLDKNDMTVHACVYVADKIVFTKNGADQVSPWVLMDVHDVLAYYYEFQPLKLVVLRQKGRPAPPAPPPGAPRPPQIFAMDD